MDIAEYYDDNGIHYYLSFETLLGAVKHQGLFSGMMTLFRDKLESFHETLRC